MVLTPIEKDTVMRVLTDYEGRHSNTVLNALMTQLQCGPTRAGNVLREAVRMDMARIDGLKVYGGKK